MTPQSTTWRKRSGLVLKIGLSLALLALVGSAIDTQQLGQHLRSVEPLGLLAAALLFNLSQLCSTWRLQGYLQQLPLVLDARSHLQLYYLGMFYNTFLPGGIGGDGYKLWLLTRHSAVPLKRSTIALLVDRGSGLAALLMLMLISGLCSPDLRSLLQQSAPPGLTVALLLALICLPLGYRQVHQRLWGGHGWRSLGLSIGIQLLQGGAVLCLLAAIGADLTLTRNDGSVWSYLSLFWLSSLLTILPITIGGIGLRELTFLQGAALLHLPTALGVTASLLFFGITLLSALVGGCFIGINWQQRFKPAQSL